MFQIQVTQIENGFLVALPPGRLVQEMALKQGQQPQPIVSFGQDYTAVCKILKENWPISVVDK